MAWRLDAYTCTWPKSGLAAAIGVGIVAQVSPIAAYIVSAGSGALSADKAAGYVVLVLEVLLAFLVEVPAWRGTGAPSGSRRRSRSLAHPNRIRRRTAWVGAVDGAGAIGVPGMASAVHVVAMREARTPPAQRSPANPLSCIKDSACSRAT